MSEYLLRLKYGNAVVLVLVSLLNVPGFVVRPTINCLALEIPVTVKTPLNPEFPTPVFGFLHPWMQ